MSRDEWALVRFVLRSRANFLLNMVLNLGGGVHHKKFRVYISKIGQDTEVRFEKC